MRLAHRGHACKDDSRDAQIGAENLEVEHSTFTITASDLHCPEQYVSEGRNKLRRGDLIIYDVARYTAATENIFYGPYWVLPPAVYLFWFNGELDGELKVDFAEQHERIILRERLISDFTHPLCLAVTKNLAEFEVRGFRTSSLNALRLDSIAVEAMRFPARS